MIEFASESLQAVIPLGEFWAIEERYCRVLLKELDGMNLVAHTDAYNARVASSAAADKPAYPYQFDNGIALLNVEGVLTKKPTSMSGGTSSVQGKSLTRHARRNADVHTLMLNFDSSPGGSVEGISQWADEIWAARQDGKRTVAVVRDMCGSAAYFLAAQCEEMYLTSPTDVTGSIGTYSVLEDLSKMADEKGVKVHVVRPDGYDYKGMGVPGTEITDEHLAYAKERVTQINNHFVKTVDRGRGIPEDKLKSWGGRSFVGQEAHSVGLVDGIYSFDDIIGAVHRAQSLGTRRTELYPATPAVASNPPAKPGKGGRRVMENQALATAFAAAGHSALSTAVATAGETPEAVAKAIGREFETAQTVSDPRLKMLDEAGITSAEELKKLQGDAAFGIEKENELRAYGKKMAIAALGQDKGAARADSIASMPREVLGDVVASYEEIEAAKTGRGADGNSNRQTASAKLDVGTFSLDTKGSNEAFDDGIAAKIRKQNGVKA